MKKVVETRNDMAFYLKLFPLVQIHPEAYKKAKAIVCEQDNEKALKMLEDAYDKKKLPDPECETEAVDETLKLGRAFGIRGTPTIVFPDGSKTSGAIAAPELIKLMEERQK